MMPVPAPRSTTRPPAAKCSAHIAYTSSALRIREALYSGRAKATLETLVRSAAAIKTALIQRDPYEVDLRRPLQAQLALVARALRIQLYGVPVDPLDSSMVVPAMNDDPHGAWDDIPGTVQAVFFGLGSDGTVGANKNTVSKAYRSLAQRGYQLLCLGDGHDLISYASYSNVLGDGVTVDLTVTDLGIVLGTYEPTGPVRHGQM